MSYLAEPNMSYCPTSLSFSEAHSDNRVEAASEALGEGVVKRVLAYALFLMGARREDIARHLSIPLGTLLSLLTRIGKDGLPALEDRRQSRSDFLPSAEARAPVIEVTSGTAGIALHFGAERSFGAEGRTVSIPASNPLQTKVVLLTLLANGWLARSDVARLLGYSPTHTARLARELAEGDVPALLDKRQGQKEDYRVPPEVKAELVQQFAVDVIARGKTSGEAISSELQERCHIIIQPRTVRYHLARMGLPAIRHSLPELVAAVKKTSRKSS
jgi:hypothetical protein